ncbi:hypothetical protein [Brachybacterium massiliense]|uniref:hypothetical protein n=1 Tax=Brachybacterium massiliense TaxID=1755098 RepID=UPI000B3BBBBF|nr:hypothetical protein [Brachybacterium massiliense]
MSVLLFLSGLAVKAVLLLAIAAVLVAIPLVWWDCTAGPSAGMAREHAQRGRPVVGVGGR